MRSRQRQNDLRKRFVSSDLYVSQNLTPWFGFGKIIAVISLVKNRKMGHFTKLAVCAFSPAWPLRM
jgi:hypothetical protein